MTVIFILKFFHFLSLFFAGGIGIGGAVIQSVHMKAGEVPSPLVGRALRILALLGLIALIIIWLTGLGLHHLLYPGSLINTAFIIKLVAAGALLLLSGFSNLHLYQSAKAQRPPNPMVMKRATQLSRAAIIVVLAGAAIAFSG